MKPFPKKSRDFIRLPLAKRKFITLLVGAVRSGKTYAVIAAIILLSAEKVEGHRLLVGQSKEVIIRNLLDPLSTIVGEKNFTLNRNTGECRIFGVKWIVIGASDAGSERYIRGLTASMIVVEEATLLQKPIWDMLISRLSTPNAVMIASTNPDSPYHWLKKDVIDNPKLADRLQVIEYTIDDNAALTEETKENYKRSFSGVFYKRMILGMWTAAEGSVYASSFDEDRNLYTNATRPIGLLGQGGHRERIIAVDYGTTHCCVFLEFFDDGRTLWLEREYVYDSTKSGVAKTDFQYGNDFDAFVAGHPTRPTIIVDPAAASFIAELRNRGHRIVRADNEVLDGIRITASMMQRGLIRMNKDNCPTWPQILSYSWDPKSAKSGEESVIKVNDDWVDPLRYCVKTKISPRRLMAA